MTPAKTSAIVSIMTLVPNDEKLFLIAQVECVSDLALGLMVSFF